MKNEYLDTIKYISFRTKKNGSLKIIDIPIAIKEKSELKEYLYDISNEKYFEFMKKLIYSPYGCNIYSVFGNKYYGYMSIIKGNNLIIHSHDKMKYKNTYFNSIKNKNRRFRLIEI